MNRYNVYINIVAVLLFILNIFSHIDTYRGNDADIVLHDLPCYYYEEEGGTSHFYHQFSVNQNTISDKPASAKKSRRNTDSSPHKCKCSYKHTYNSHNQLIYNDLFNKKALNFRLCHSLYSNDIFIIIHKLLI